MDNPYRLLEGKGGRVVTLRVNERPTADGAREVRVVFVSRDAPVGHSAAPPAARALRYEGSALTVKPPSPDGTLGGLGGEAAKRR